MNPPTTCRNCHRPGAVFCAPCHEAANLAPVGVTLAQAEDAKDAAYWAFSRSASSAGLNMDPAIVYRQVKALTCRNRLEMS